MAKRNIPYLNESGQLVKRCIECGEAFEVNGNNFYKHPGMKDGFLNKCKVCVCNHQKASRLENRAEYYAKKKKKYDANREEILRHRKIKYQENRDELLAKRKVYFKNNRDKINEGKRKWRKANIEKVRAAAREYFRTEKGLEAIKRRCEKIKNDPMLALSSRVSKAIWAALRGAKNGAHWETLVGFTLFELKDHIEKQFTGEMTWEKFLNGEIHLDHKIPQSVFNFKTVDDIDFKRCWCLDNLQPLWAKENMSKNAKLEKPFQPSLAFGGALT